MDIDDIAAVIAGAVREATEPLKARIEALETRELVLPEKGDPGEPGRDCDMVEVASLVENAVKSAVEALPAPKDGEPGKDGVGLADALIDRSGALVVTLTDGTSKSLGTIIGRDGEDGIGVTLLRRDDDLLTVEFSDGQRHEFDLPTDACPDETNALVAEVQRAMAEAPELSMLPPPLAIPAPAEVKQPPIVMNLGHHQGAAAAPRKVVKTVTTRRDASGNLVADIVEEAEA
jgi:hypothetical protein